MSLLHVALSHRSGQFHLQSRVDWFVKLLKNLSYKMQCHIFPKTVNARGLFLILLLSGDIAVNPGTTMGIVNIRCISTKGLVISNNITSHNIDLLCLTEMHIRTSDTNSLLKSQTYQLFIPTNTLSHCLRRWCWIYHQGQSLT